MMSAKMATSGLLKITVFWNKGYDVIIPVDDVTNKILSRDSNYIVDVFMWPKFGNSSIGMREVITTLIKDLTRKTTYFEGWSWLKFNNLGLALGMNVKFCTRVAKGLKLRVRKFWGAIPMFVEDTGRKLVGRSFLPCPNLNRVKVRLSPSKINVLFAAMKAF